MIDTIDLDDLSRRILCLIANYETYINNTFITFLSKKRELYENPNFCFYHSTLDFLEVARQELYNIMNECVSFFDEKYIFNKLYNHYYNFGTFIYMRIIGRSNYEISSFESELILFDEKLRKLKDFENDFEEIHEYFKYLLKERINFINTTNVLDLKINS